MRGSHSCFLRHRAGRRAPHLRSTHSTARLPTGREAQPPAKQQVCGRAVQSQVRKENPSLRGWAGPGWNPDSGCPPLRASVGLPPNSSQAQSTMGLPPSRGARTALRSHSGPATRSRLGRRLPGARGPRSWPRVRRHPRSRARSAWSLPSESIQPRKTLFARVCPSEPWGQDSVLCGDPTSWSITQMLSPSSHHAQSSFSSRPQALGALVSAWTPALSASCSSFFQQRHPTFLGGAAPPLHSGWVEIAPLPPCKLLEGP